MNYIVEIFNISPGDAIEIKQSLLEVYNMQDTFTWRWIPTVLEPSGWTVKTPAHAKFEFASESDATFFKLKYIK